MIRSLRIACFVACLFLSVSPAWLSPAAAGYSHPPPPTYSSTGAANPPPPSTGGVVVTAPPAVTSSPPPCPYGQVFLYSFTLTLTPTGSSTAINLVPLITPSFSPSGPKFFYELTLPAGLVTGTLVFTATSFSVGATFRLRFNHGAFNYAVEGQAVIGALIEATNLIELDVLQPPCAGTDIQEYSITIYENGPPGPGTGTGTGTGTGAGTGTGQPPSTGGGQGTLPPPVTAPPGTGTAPPHIPPSSTGPQHHCPPGHHCPPPPHPPKFCDEGEPCEGFAPTIKRCKPGLICVHNNPIPDVPGICRRQCKHNDDCKFKGPDFFHPKQYCSKAHFCLPLGQCSDKSDCKNSWNNFPCDPCQGDFQCNYGQCKKVCNPKGKGKN